MFKYNKKEIKIKISVILPVYNVEAWIGECIESLKSQTLTGLEFIFVDDCGTDNSMRIVESWAAEDERVRIIHNHENLGVGASRNIGIEAARGEYLSFVDPDDWISNDFYKKLYKKARGTGLDIVKGRRLKLNNSDEIATSQSDKLSRKTNERILTRSQEGAPLYTRFTNEHSTAIYKSSLFHDSSVRYGSTDYSEDVTFLLRACYETESIALVDDAAYYYRNNPKSSTSSYTFERSMEELKALEESVDFLEGKQANDWGFLYLQAKIRTRLKNYYYVTRDYNITEENQQKYVDRFRNLINRLHHHPLLFRDYPQLRVFLKTGQIINPKPKISVIIPMYKCSDFIDDLMDSVCNQSLRDTEIICVLDGEDEDILKAIEKRSESDGRIICIEQLHSGAGTARNTGLDIARGDYLLFLDADDLFETHMFETMYDEAVKWNADTVMCSYTETNEWDKSTHTNKGFDQGLMPENRLLNPSDIPELLVSYIGVPWNKMFRRSMIKENGLRFSNTRIMNDEFFVTAAMTCTKRLVTIHKDLLTVRRYISKDSIPTNRAAYKKS
ncbi:MAG: glycosyltransferase [Lachnospiraceae bacterium]|nr:glycosyltransferase [Lachnospiraceae bacterium]